MNTFNRIYLNLILNAAIPAISSIKSTPHPIVLKQINNFKKEYITVTWFPVVFFNALNLDISTGNQSSLGINF